MSARVVALVAALLALTAAFACSTPADSRFQATTPDEATFKPTALVLVHRCGSLDCHGTLERNLRLYGGEGRRWSSTDVPVAAAEMTDDERHQDFLSVIGLEPEVLSAVVAEGGAHPERLTLVRKARGTEHHKGGTIFQEGDDSDRCLTSWLAGKVDTTACAAGLKK